MRRSITALTLFSSLALVACEDGPSQTYSASPNGAGGAWNDGKTPASTDPNAKQGYLSAAGGTNLIELCDAPKKAARWKKMVNEPIIPPTTGGGLNISGGDDWHGMTIEEAEAINCQSTNAGDQFGNGTLVNVWGDNGELWMDYRVSTRKANWLNMWQGYRGTIKFDSADGAHKYELPVFSQIQKDGANVSLEWTKASSFQPLMDEFYRGLMHAFSPAIPVSPAGVTCFDTGRCIQGSFGDVAYWYIPAIGFALWVDNQNAAQPTPSIPTRFDQDLAKTMAYSFASPLLKLDAEGPIAFGGEILPGKECKLQIGTTFGDFLGKCVQTTGDAVKDKIELNKLLGGLSHGTERFSFDVTGVDVNFSDNTLPDDSIIRDGDIVTNDDVASFWDIDQATLGTILNDLAADRKTLDLHGTGLVYKEYARIVRQTLLTEAGIKDGATPEKDCNYPVGWAADPAFDPADFADKLPAYCTGFEGFITPYAGTAAVATSDLGMDALLARSAGGTKGTALKTGLKPGHQKVVFCDDANGDRTKSASGKSFTKGYDACSSGDNFLTSFNRVVKVFGKGKIGTLPTEAQDVRLYWRLYFQALVKYFKYEGMTTKPADLSTVKIDQDRLFFDSVGAGQFEIAEYVDRDYANKTTFPTDLSVTADVKNGIFSGYTFGRELYRGEKLMYAAVLENQADGLGQEDSALLTNLFGSPLLKSGWSDVDADHSAYYCATHVDPKGCGGQVGPTDAAGKLIVDERGKGILERYHGAFSTTPFTLGNTKVTIKKTYDTIQSAMVSVPLTKNPYDSTSESLPAMELLVPWVPKQPGIGFPVAVNGSHDKFVTTGQLDLSGTTITANIDYDIQIDPTTKKANKDGLLEFKAVETTDFLGKVFVCQDPASGDILSVSMYAPVANILDWLESHPGTYSSCSIIIRYSPYGNFADYITSLANGVRLGITQGGGFGRVVDVTLNEPGL